MNQISGGGHYILSSFSGHDHRHGSTWNCASNLAGADPRRPVATEEAFPGARRQISLHLEETFRLQNSPAGYSACCAAVMLGNVNRIGLPMLECAPTLCTDLNFSYASRLCRTLASVTPPNENQKEMWLSFFWKKYRNDDQYIADVHNSSANSEYP